MMKPTKSEETLLKQVQDLPEEAVRQIIDFAQFLRRKHSYNNEDATDTTSLSMSQTAHLEEEFSGYQQLYPREDG
jgi:hypothetical protein